MPVNTRWCRIMGAEKLLWISCSLGINWFWELWNIISRKLYRIWSCGHFHLNSVTPGKFEWNFRYVTFKQILVIDVWGNSCLITLIWMPLGSTDDQSTLVQVMAWCRQATRRYLSQCWPISLSPYGVTRPQWVNKNDFLMVRLLYVWVGIRQLSWLNWS